MASNMENPNTLRLKNIKYIKNELELLHKCCIAQKQNAFYTKKAAEPFIRDINNRKDRLYSLPKSKTVFKISVFVCLVALLLSQQSVRKFAISTIRHTSMTALAIWDWRKLHDIPCFLQNPLKQDDDKKELLEEDCKICANMTTVPKMKGSSMEEISENYLKKELPVIVLSSVEELSRSHTKTNIDTIFKLYLDDDIMNLYSCCNFDSNITIKKKNHRTFLTNLREGQYIQYYAHWENCFTDAAKLFRQLYKRPEFLPSTVELAENNWLLLSSNYTEHKAIQMPFEDGIVMLIQLAGYIDLVLKPKSDCQGTCKAVTVQLMQGSVFIMTDLLYDLEYRPTKGKQAITIGIGGSFDY